MHTARLCLRACGLKPAGCVIGCRPRWARYVSLARNLNILKALRAARAQPNRIMFRPVNLDLSILRRPATRVTRLHCTPVHLHETLTGGFYYLLKNISKTI